MKPCKKETKIQLPGGNKSRKRKLKKEKIENKQFKLNSAPYSLFYLSHYPIPLGVMVLYWRHLLEFLHCSIASTISCCTCFYSSLKNLLHLSRQIVKCVINNSSLSFLGTFVAISIAILSWLGV